MSQRLDDVEDDLEHLNRRFKKLQTQVTRRWRDDTIEEEEEDDEDIGPGAARRALGLD